MLDNHLVSHIMQGRDAQLLARLTQLSVGQRVHLKNALVQIVLRMDVLPRDEKVATCYGEFCSRREARGINLSDFDMMIA